MEDDIPAMHLVGAHGSAGVTTLAHVLAPAADSGITAPDDPRYPYVFIVCDATVTGLDKAQVAAYDLGSDDVEILGVVLVHKAPGGLSKAVKGKLRVVQAAIGGEVYEVPFQKTWQDTPVENLPVWKPTVEETRRRFSRKAAVPKALAVACEKMCRAVVARENERNEENL